MPAATSPEDVVQRYLLRLNARDLEGLVSLYDPAAVFIPKTGGKLTGHDAIRAALAQTLALEPQLELTTAEVHLADDIALVANDYRFAGKAPDGSVIRDVGRSAVVMRRRPDGGWVIVVDRL